MDVGVCFGVANSVGMCVLGVCFTVLFGLVFAASFVAWFWFGLLVTWIALVCLLRIACSL